jgi:hypothetical protein
VGVEPYACPQCGAIFPSGETCQDYFNTGQIKEVEHPDTYYTVHHLSVPCYMLQHNAYSRPGWLSVRELLSQFVFQGLLPAEARRRYRQSWGSGQRTWSITKGPKLEGVENLAWSVTVADVRLDTAEHYCADVRRWAESVLADSEQLVAGQAP